MKTKLLFGLALLATLGMTSCKKDKDEPKEATTVKIGDKDYAIVKIGDQTWTAQNYSGEGGVATSKTEYGKLYTINEAKAIQLPQGWRLPTKADFIKLLQDKGATFTSTTDPYYGETTTTDPIKSVISLTNWQYTPGTNTTGFNAFPVGFYHASFGSSLQSENRTTVFWTSSVDPENKPINFYIANKSDGSFEAAYENASRLDDEAKLSIRFVKDNN